MKRHIQYRPNKAVGIFNVVWGCVFILVGLLVAIPMTGAFGVLWTIIAIAITVFNAYQAFGKKYVGPDITIEDEEDKTSLSGASHGHTPQERLEQLETLKRSDLITDEEYREKRKEILSDL